MLEILLVMLILALDQWTKHLADIFLLPLGTSIPIWEGVFHLTSAHNRGAAFGMLQGWRVIFLIVTAISCLAIVYILITYRKRLHTLLRICLACILAGALGNFIDRAFLVYVRDMLDFRLINFAIFNVADSAVTIGATLLALDLFFGKSRALYDGLGSEDKPDTLPAQGGEAVEPPPLNTRSTAIEHIEAADLENKHGDS